jgi:hypothetical protein
MRQVRTTKTRGRLLVLLLCFFLAPQLAHAAQSNCYGPYTLNSDNYAPDTTGDDTRDWVGDFTINLAIASGTMNVSVEAKLDGGGYASLGQMTTTGIAQFHGPLHRLRYLVSSCSSCVATIIACANRGQ